MIPYEDLVAALATWRARNGLPTGPADYLGEPPPPPPVSFEQYETPSGPATAQAEEVIMADDIESVDYADVEAEAAYTDAEPVAEYDAADAEYEAPDAEYEAPDAEYEAPDAEYEAPDAEYEAPAPELEAHSAEYEAPHDAADQYMPAGDYGDDTEDPGEYQAAVEMASEEYDAPDEDVQLEDELADEFVAAGDYRGADDAADQFIPAGEYQAADDLVAAAEDPASQLADGYDEYDEATQVGGGLDDLLAVQGGGSDAVASDGTQPVWGGDLGAEAPPEAPIAEPPDGDPEPTKE